MASNYLQLRGLDAQLVAARETLGTYASRSICSKLQFKYGQVSQMNVAQAQSQYETAAAQIPLIESQIAQNQNPLSVLIGRDPGPIARGKSIETLTLPSVPAGVPSELLERRPDLLQAEQQLIATNAQIGAAKALYFPTISLTGLLGSVSTAFGDFLSGPATAWSVAGGLTGPIFTFGAIEGQVQTAEALQREALANYQQVILNAFRETNDALVGAPEEAGGNRGAMQARGFAARIRAAFAAEIR